jgi:phospholipid/cholesterol/gamma-HCH transport system ATP-binding protein
MTAEAEVQEQTNLPQDVRPSETLTPILAQGENQDLSTPAVEFRNVHFFFDDEKVLDGISFTVMRGEIKIILSGSGGGKSTILKLILGLLKPDEGQVLIDDEDITNYDESQLKPARDKIGMVFQEGGLFDSLFSL